MARRFEPSTQLQKNKGMVYDFYQTPSYVTKTLLRREKFRGSILEPCCGDGAILKVLQEKTRNKLIASDIQDKFGVGSVKDFLSYKKAANIITNPPFTYALPFIKHGLSIYTGKIAFLMRISFLETIKRYEELFAHNPPARIYVYTRRINFDEGKPFGGTLLIGWWIWEKGHSGPTTIDWIHDNPDEV